MKRWCLFTLSFVASGLLSFNVIAAGKPICGQYACATFSINNFGITEVVFNSRVAQELSCWVKVQDAPVKFKLRKKSRIYSAGYGFNHTQYLWRCDIAKA